MKTMIINRTQKGVKVYHVNSNEILDKTIKFLNICPTHSDELSQEYKWFKKKHNYKNIYIYHDFGEITFGVLRKKMDDMSKDELNFYIESIVHRTELGKIMDLLYHGPEGMFNRRGA